MEPVGIAHPPGSAVAARPRRSRSGSDPLLGSGGRAGEQGVPRGAPSAAALEARAPLLSIDARPVPTHPGAQLHSPGPLLSPKRRPPLRALSPGLLPRVRNGGGQSLGGHPLAAGPLAGGRVGRPGLNLRKQSSFRGSKLRSGKAFQKLIRPKERRTLLEGAPRWGRGWWGVGHLTPHGLCSPGGLQPSLNLLQAPAGQGPSCLVNTNADLPGGCPQLGGQLPSTRELPMSLFEAQPPGAA